MQFADRSKYGAAAGTILIDNGLMTVENPAVGQLGVKQMMGVKVTFHRWVKVTFHKVILVTCLLGFI